MVRPVLIKLLLAALLLALVAACAGPPRERPTPTATSTTTPIPPAPRNDNVEALNSAQASLGEFHFGLAPLLLLDDTRVTLETEPGAEVPYLRYPPQPADPTDWPGVDSYVLSYATRAELFDSAAVSRVTLGQFHISASVENAAQAVLHTAAWITFRDGSQAVVDLSPLSTNFAPRHIPETMLVDDLEIETKFSAHREGVSLSELQPMAVMRQEGNLYYLLAQVKVSYERYIFSLQAHQVQPADPMRPMELYSGDTVAVEIDRDQFEKLQELVGEAGEDVFSEHPELLTRRGKNDETLTALLDDNVNLLWHLITKFEHQPPDPDLPTPTPVPTVTPTPTPAPSPTATPRKLPLITS
ncbi:MAG: hypothetical protein Kow0031_06290 [Anaerolineae bacterium]